MPARADSKNYRNPGLQAGGAVYRAIVNPKAFGVRKALQDMIGFAAGLGVEKGDLATLELVLAEVLNNIVEHSCGDVPGAIIRLSCRFEDNRVVMTVTDNGAPLQEGSAPDSVLPRGHGNIESLPEGGFGWFIIRRLTQNLTYRRRNERNFLMFTIRFLGR